MQAVLYTRQLEPITIITLQPFLWQRLQRGEPVRLHVMERLTLAQLRGDGSTLKLRTVTIHGEQLRYREQKGLMLFTDDETDALLLTPDFLPGQRYEQQRRERLAFVNGIMEAINGLGE